MASFPSLTTILSVIFLAYMANSLWTIAQLFLPPQCPEGVKLGSKECLRNDLGTNPERTFLLMTSLKERPNLEKDLTFLTAFDVKDPSASLENSVKVEARI